jgi:hypothetical protein
MIDTSILPLFIEFYQEFEGSCTRGKISDAQFRENSWLIFHADDEFMTVAKLKFDLLVLAPWGTSIEFND